MATLGSAVPFAQPLLLLEWLDAIPAPWAVAGGWAIDLYLGFESREHGDIEVALLRRDQQSLHAYLHGWQWHYVVPKTGGVMAAWAPGECLALPVHEIHGTGPVGERLEVLLNEAEGDRWRFRKNLAIGRPLGLALCTSPSGVPFLAPEIVLLYKALGWEPSGCRPKDAADYRQVRDRLAPGSRDWLWRALAACVDDHPWLDELAPENAVHE